MKYVPFTAYIEVFPTEPGKRTENVRELQKFATYIYDAIDGIATINLALPEGSGQTSSGMPRGLTSACGITPQIGEQPPKLMVTGFNLVDTTNDSIQTEPTMTIITNGTTWTGYGGAHHFDQNPETTVTNEVKALKTTLESAIDLSLPAVYTYSIISINYNGIKWGDRGLTFPR